MPSETVFWADQLAAEARARCQNNLICTGITPSGEIHIGNMREILSGEAVYRALAPYAQDAQAGAGQTRFVFLGDTFDALRRVYPFLDAARYQEMVGKPISEIPCPCGKHESYAAHFLEPFLTALGALGVKAEVMLAHEMYRQGVYTDAIFTALERRDDVARILHEVTGKEIAPNWSAVNPKCGACGRITDAQVLSFKREDSSVDYSCACGHRGSANAALGEAKLTWRVDWPARWKILGVTIEPFGKDHASRGGSYDSGRVISQEIFGYEAPLPVIYEWISLKGQGDMSSSKGNVISTADMVNAVPPDVLRYMVFRAQPKKALTFDPGLPMLSLIDELDDPESKVRDPRASELALITGMGSVGVPFKHLVNIVQMAGADDEEALSIIRRGGYDGFDEGALKKRLTYARAWLERYAPEDIKFSKCADLPELARDFSPEIRRALAWFAGRLSGALSADQIHALFYETKDACQVEANAVFEAFYLSVIGKKRGPRAGWFVKTLGTDWVQQRLLAAAEEP
jgi:lysyl-tRNA synthetase class 1